MPRYFFNVHDGRDLVDTEGSDLSGLDHARQEAVRTAGELLRDGGHADFWSGEEWQMVVTDERGLEVFTLTFKATQPGFQGPQRRR